MKEHWMTETKQNAKDLAKELYERIIHEADDICVYRQWYFEKVISYMTAENEEKENG